MAKKADQTFRINGRVIDSATQRGIAGLRVEAWDKDLISNDLVGSSVTDQQGAFQIEFTSAYFATLFVDQQPDLFFKVFRGEELIKSTESSILWNVRAGATAIVIEIDAPIVPSEWERLSVGVVPLLGDLRPWELTDEDITFLSDAAGIDRQLIVFFGASALRAKEEDVLRQPIFYGWFRLGLPTELDALWETGTEVLLTTLETAIRDKIVPLMSDRELRDVVARVLVLKGRRALQPGRENEPASLGDLLATLPLAEALSPEQAFAFAKLWVEYGDTDKLWKQADASELSAAVPALKRTLALSEITAGYLPLVRALQTKADAEHPESLKPLATLRPDEWIDLVYQYGAPGGVAPVEYAETLAAAVERRLLTQMLSKELERTPSKSQTFPTDKVIDFLKTNPNFDLTASHVEPYLNEVESRDEALREGLLTMQRIYAISANAQETALLLEAGFSLATQIISMGESAFALKVAGLISLERAGEIFAVAERVVTTTSRSESAGGGVDAGGVVARSRDLC